MSAQLPDFVARCLWRVQQQHLPPPPPPILNPGPISQAATYSGAQVALLMHVDESGDAVGRPPATTVIRDTIGLTFQYSKICGGSQF